MTAATTQALTGTPVSTTSVPVTAATGPMGSVFTRRWAADLVLDLAGYLTDKPLWKMRVLEPACGDGAFLVPIVERLIHACNLSGTPVETCQTAIAAFDLDKNAIRNCRANVRQILVDTAGLTPAAAGCLVRTWIRQADFLLEPPTTEFDLVVGNPPYVRLEAVPDHLSDAYRRAWPTMSGRADLFVGFFEAGLTRLAPGGVLTFICADRWMRSQYGARLRTLVEDRFAVDATVTLHDADAFKARVNAYPAIVVLRRGPQGRALVAEADSTFAQPGATHLTARKLTRPRNRWVDGPGYRAAWIRTWPKGTVSWPAGSPARIALTTELERRFRPLQDPETGTKVGIGVATGLDRVFITTDTSGIEPDRLLPLVTADDLHDTTVAWSGRYLLNPWDDQGKLVNLTHHPKLRARLRLNEAELRQRHVGIRNPNTWWRTIDKVAPGLQDQTKLLLPDLRRRVQPALDNGSLYPHHNLFWITSDTWDPRVLGGLLLCDVATLFVETYSPRMAGGALRVTAQYLRRIRVPDHSTLPTDLAHRLATAFDRNDAAAATEAALEAYGIDRLPD